MSESLDELDKLPGSVKLGVAGVGGAGIAAAFLKSLNDPVVLTILIVGTLLVILLLLLWGRVVKWKQAGQAKVFREGLGAQLRATPQQVTDADSRAKLDDLRRKLQEGIDKMNATGKGVYVLPWYLMVGEPGSGKTKAVAAAGIALPGFQDPLQGAGGTVNMNWWFTNSGVILDTAGRLMLPEVATSHNPEWDEFLKTLGRRRPNCPVNGLILTIPADTLLTDETSEIERKAGEIAYQFNKVQSVLGIRFPVFVLVTKCDKILGFREFFESLNQPDQQAQMMGWSKPGSLDEPFRPDQVDQHLQKVHEQLIRRRLALIQDPVHTEVAEGRRLDQVDALYELPDALLSVGPRLRRYLEPIFIAGPLSSRPLFLRGIYFTSSLQTGEALDKAISEIMGRDIAAEQGGPIVSAKPYFLRDLFQEKVFMEHGLVTRTDNVALYKRRRKRNLLLAGCAAAMVLIGLTWLGKQQLQNRIEGPQTFWENLASSRTPLISESDGTIKYTGATAFVDNKRLSADVHASVPAEVGRTIKIPVIYDAVARVGTDLNQERRVAYAAFFENEVLSKVVDAARERVEGRPAEQWTEADTNALYHLMLIEEGKELSKDEEASSRPLVALTTYVLPDEERKKFDDDQDKWDKTFRWLYSPTPDGGGAKWPPKSLGSGGKTINAGLEKFVAFVGRTNARAKGSLDDCREAARILVDLEELETKKLLQLPLAAHNDQWETTARPVVSGWKPELQAYGEKVAALERVLTSLRQDGFDRGKYQSIGEFYKATINDLASKTEDAAFKLKKELPQSVRSDVRGKLQKLIDEAQALRADLAQGEVAQQLAGHEKKFLLPWEKPTYRRHFDVLTASDAMVPTELEGLPPRVDVATVGDLLAALDQKARKAREEVARLAGPPQPGLPDAALRTLADGMIDLGAKRRRYLLLAASLDAAPPTADAWRDRVKELARGASNVSKVKLPLTSLDGSDGHALRDDYDPSVIQKVIDWLAAIDGYAQITTPTPMPSDHDPMDLNQLRQKFLAVNKTWGQFKHEYDGYWLNDVPKAEQVRQDLPWATYQAGLKAINVESVDDSLRVLRQMQAQAQAHAHAQAVPNAPAPQPGEIEFLNSCKACCTRWAEFTGADEARVKLLSVAGEQRYSEYLVGVTPRQGDRYWSGLFMGALNTVAVEANAAAEGAAAKLKDYNRFPLAPPSPRDKELTRDELIEVQRLLTKLTDPTRPRPEPAVAAVRNAPAPNPIDSAVMAALAKLEGRDAAAKNNIAQDLVRQVDLVNALAAGKLRCNITFLKDPKDNVGTPLPLVTLFQNNQPLERIEYRKGFELRYNSKPEPAGGIELANARGPIALAFSATADPNSFKANAEIGGIAHSPDAPQAQSQWPCLRTVVADGDDRIVKPDTEPMSWRVTFKKVKSGATGANYYTITYGVKFFADKQPLNVPVQSWNPEAR